MKINENGKKGRFLFTIFLILNCRLKFIMISLFYINIYKRGEIYGKNISEPAIENLEYLQNLE